MAMPHSAPDRQDHGNRVGGPPRLARVPELPEVEALALDLKGRLADRAIAKVHVVAISALKTFDPPVQALEGTLVEDVTRHGKFLDIADLRACT